MGVAGMAGGYAARRSNRVGIGGRKAVTTTSGSPNRRCVYGRGADADGGPEPTRLARRLGLLDAVVIGLGAMIGAGVFAAAAPAADAAAAGCWPAWRWPLRWPTATPPRPRS
jgi:hypothetical protein